MGRQRRKLAKEKRAGRDFDLFLETYMELNKKYPPTDKMSDRPIDKLPQDPDPKKDD